MAHLEILKNEVPRNVVRGNSSSVIMANKKANKGTPALVAAVIRKTFF